GLPDLLPSDDLHRLTNSCGLPYLLPSDDLHRLANRLYSTLANRLYSTLANLCKPSDLLSPDDLHELANRLYSTLANLCKPSDMPTSPQHNLDSLIFPEYGC